MKESIKEIIDNNPTGRFVFWCKMKEEQLQLKELLTELGYQCVVPLPENWDNMFNRQVPIGYMINMARCDVSYNNSLEHWKQCTDDIVEVNDDDSLDWA